VKLPVVGRGGAGKTSLTKRLRDEPFDPHEGETHGINIRELELACADGPVHARAWDFGGQHVLHAMHEFFLTPRSLYLLVLGERDDMAERDAAYWLQLVLCSWQLLSYAKATVTLQKEYACEQLNRARFIMSAMPYSSLD
jgi:GTPase SAR1 family protein